MTTQDSQSDELDKILGHCDFEPEVDNWARCKWCGESKHNRMHTAKQAIEAYVTTRVKEALELARSKDPHKCEFGHEVYSHNTVDGWCCACEADQAFMEGQIKEVERLARIDELDGLVINHRKENYTSLGSFDINDDVQNVRDRIQELQALTTTTNGKEE